MRKIIVGAQVSLDGVMQAPGGPSEDPTNGFKSGDWSMPYFDQAFDSQDDAVRGIDDKTMIIIGDADAIELCYAIELFKLRGGGDHWIKNRPVR